MKYFVTIGGREIEVEVEGDQVRVGGRQATAHLLRIPGTPLRHLLLDQESLTLSVERRERGEWQLGVAGSRYEARVVDERARHIQSLTGGTRAKAGPAVLKAPMPGLVVRVLASEGQVVEVGQGLVVLEAMKMENELRATAPGVVQAVRVSPGQAVDKGQLLIEFAPEPVP
jgi:biotin carboxyl carrier protein